MLIDSGHSGLHPHLYEFVGPVKFDITPIIWLAILMISVIRHQYLRRIENNPRIGRPVGVLLSRISLKNVPTTETALFLCALKD
jgi:hypothetical protein